MSEYEHNMEHEALNFEKQQAFAVQSEAAKKIEAVGIERHFDSLDDEAKAELFEQTDTRLGCIDEGCNDCGRREAGSGILNKSSIKEQAARCQEMDVQRSLITRAAARRKNTPWTME